MTISKRTLEKWRKEALEEILIINKRPKETLTSATHMIEENNKKILHLTQELLDQQLLERR